MSAGEHLVVVGHGMAAVRLVETLVAGGWVTGGGRLTVLGEEPGPAYNRILLSAVLEGTHDPRATVLRDEEWYAEHGVVLRTGVRVAQVDRDAREVVLVDRDRVPYDRLVLATGSIPTLPPIRGLVRPDGTLHPTVHAFRSQADCRGLLAALARRDSPVRRAVVVGGGLLGLQVARALSSQEGSRTGRSAVVTEIVEGAPHVLSRQLDRSGASILARDLARLGTTTYAGARATGLVPSPMPEHAVGVRLDNGHVLATDLVVLTAGGRPSVALARGAGLEVRRGVVVDDLLTTSDPRVHAVGDCAQHAGRVSGFVGPAWDQAGALAAQLLARRTGGEVAPYPGNREVARLRATGLDVAVIGDPEAEAAAGGEVVAVTNPITRSHRKLVVRGGRIVAAALVGDLARVGLLTQYVERGTVLGPHEPGDLLLPEARSAATGPADLPDDAEVCACAGVSAGAVRACASVEDVRATTRATTGCGGCASSVRALLAARPPVPAPA
ncbi:FAD-dependent oxidoreductase [Nocardioides sp. CPCC 205120]|uniref:FAD-dependent oxidoreductase n=1 Tax=Nocardioides sp. CPCC 205120 TaxID=3406462 RepID=UPI003B50F3E6